jgi:hypothetical protein
MKKLFLLAFLFALFMVMACTTEEPLPSGLDALHRANTDSLEVLTFPAVEVAQYRLPVQAGLTATLLIGHTDGITTRALVAFTSLSAVDTATVNAATLSFTQTQKWGDGAGFTCTVHRVAVDWTETSVKWQDIAGQYDAAAAASFAVSSEDSTSYEIALPPDLVNGWIGGGDNFGLLLDFSSADMIASLMSVDVSEVGYPTLKLAYTTKAGEADTVTVNPSRDATLFSYDEEPEEDVIQRGSDRLWLDNARGYRTLIRFDLSQLSKEASIYQAYLSMPVDNTLSSTDSSGITYTLYQIANDSTWQTPSAMTVDSTYSAPSGNVLGTDKAAILANSTQINYLSNMAQRWVIKKADNFGIMVQSSGYGSNLNKIALYNGPDASQLPTLRITCSFPAAVRF